MGRGNNFTSNDASPISKPQGQGAGNERAPSRDRRQPSRGGSMGMRPGFLNN